MYIVRYSTVYGRREKYHYDYNKLLDPLEPYIKFPQVVVNTDNDAMSGFIMEHAKIRYIKMNVFETKYTGIFCDPQCFYSHGKESISCLYM